NRVVTAVSGMIGLVPTLKAIEAGKIIALANKETLVAGGELVMKALEKHSGRMYPVDSEHSAIFQGLMGNENNPIYKIVLTASGGPFRDATKEMLENATLEQALKHPNWSMGKKVTIDSATLMNKGLEVIEAKWLFDLQPDQIEVVVHPQSIVHSLVEFEDHSSMAQMGYPDMKVPIQLALFYPKRVQNQLKSLRLDQVKELTFYGPDTDLFPCLALAYDALETSGTMPAVLNAANEIAVEQFLNREIRFVDIPKKLERVMNRHRPISNPSLQDVLDVDQWARKAVREKS
ncbi:MAG TPA: 1-deoxy-D-xylulose-5-phosphate reductoisomerase, partial [Eubacteriaceae bacterium]|nr:1-deoxy-D-xylulose-5-phosphate reductoisomerase [Eubacteriaceae bacterium]